MTMRDRKSKRPVAGPEDARVRLTNVGWPLTPNQLDVMEDNLANFPLPTAYRSFLLKHNGGEPDPSYFAWRHPREGEMISHVDRMLGFDPRPMDDRLRGVDVFRVSLKYRDVLPDLSVPIAFVDRDDLLLIFVNGPREGRIMIKVWCEVSLRIDEPPTREEGVHPVAESFEAFLKMLRDGPEVGHGSNSLDCAPEG